MGILCLTGGIIRTIVSIIIVTRSIVPRSVFTKSSSIKLYKEDKGLLFNSDPWPPAEQKLEMPCDRCFSGREVVCVKVGIKIAIANHSVIEMSERLVVLVT